jgi:hypothetical protein
MKTTTVSFMMVLIPAALCAQVSGQAQASSQAQAGSQAQASGQAQVGASAEFKAPSGFSAEGSAKLDAMYAEAREHHVPRQPIAHRVEEGRAKGASEAVIIASAAKVKANLEATQDAMVSAGRAHPSDEECERGASAMERGVTKAQIRAIAKSTQGDRSLVVAFDVLAKLTLNGVPVEQAVAQVQAKVSAGASDASLTSLVTAAAASNGANAAASGNATAAAKPVGGTLTTSAGAVLKKP